MNAGRDLPAGISLPYFLIPAAGAMHAGDAGEDRDAVVQSVSMGRYAVSGRIADLTSVAVGPHRFNASLLMRALY